VAALFGVSAATVRKWVGRYLAQGQASFLDRSSRPRKCPRAIAPSTVCKRIAVERETRAREAAARKQSTSGPARSPQQ